MAFAFSKCALHRCDEPSLRFIRAEIWGRRGPFPPAPSSLGFVDSSPLAPVSCTHLHPHPRSPAQAQGLGKRRRRLLVVGRRAGPQDQRWPRRFSELQRALGREPATPMSQPARQSCARPDLCPLAGPKPWWPPQSLDKQRPGAILGRGTDPRRVVGAAPAPLQTLAAHRGPLGHPLPVVQVWEDALPTLVGHTEM